MENDLSWKDWWAECVYLAATVRQLEIMDKCKNIYHDYYEEGMTPEQAMSEEWG